MNGGEDKKLGTFLGVYTPTILTILGVIMYLRFGWLLGHLGLSSILLIVLLANGITLITALSFSSVATNIRVGVGGAYYIISRSLGLEIGGAIGLPLFLSQAFSVTLYSFGLAESLKIIWPDVPIQPVAFVIIVLVGILAFTGASFALKTQLPLMVMVGVSLVMLAVGAFIKSQGGPPAMISPSGELSFWAGFAIFFPAVTGVMAGLGLSGDLRDPGRAIPLGAILAVLTGFAVYMLVPVLLALSADATMLREDSLVWTKIAPLGPWLILPGLWGAIFSSAVGSMLGAPRTLQALAMDGLAPRFLGKGRNESRELIPGLVVSVLIALGAACLGDLNAVAPFVTMFFLTTYGTLNLVAAFETLSGDPSWRPKIRVSWIVNFAGAVACIIVILLINPVVGIIAIIAELLLWMLLSRRASATTWGDARRGLYEALIRWALIRLARRPMSARNWRPHILVFVSDPLQQLDLIRFGNWFSQNRGVVTVCELVVGNLFDDKLEFKNKFRETQELLDKERLVVFAEVDVVSSVVEGITDVTQANGMAAMHSNTVMLGWPKTNALFADFLRVMRKLEKLNKSLIIGRVQPRYMFHREGIRREVHVWWGGLQNNGDLMLLLAYLLTRNPEWRNTHIRIMSIASDETMKKQTEDNLKQLLTRIRIDAEVSVFVRQPEKSIQETIASESHDADVVFFGLATPDVNAEEEYAKRLEDLAGNFPVVFFVKNSSPFVGNLLVP